MTKRVFRLRCEEIGPPHAKFTLFDPAHASCGSLTILTSDLADFIYYSWKGRVDWHGHERKGRAALREAARLPLRVNRTT